MLVAPHSTMPEIRLSPPTSVASRSCTRPLPRLTNVAPLSGFDRLVMGGLERDQDEVELFVRRLGHRFDAHGALLAQHVEPEAVVEPRDVLLARVEHDHAAHRAGQLRGGHAADRAAAYHEHGRVDHSASSLASAA